MIKVYRGGKYKLIESKHRTKILSLDSDRYAWIERTDVGEILVALFKEHQASCILSIGSYYIYDVVDEPELSDQLHLELEVGKDVWQGYLLPTGLPDSEKIRSLIIPTHETITEISKFSSVIQ